MNTKVAIFLFVVLALVNDGFSSKAASSTPNMMPSSAPLQAGPSRAKDVLKICSVALYHERADEKSREDAGLLGSGVFVAKEVSGNKRYFIATAAHILNTIIFDKGCKGYQIGLMSKSGGSIKRLSIPPKNQIMWFKDSVHDIAIADITLAIFELERTGGSVFAVDLDPVQPSQWHPSLRTLPRIQPLMDSSLARPNGNSLPPIIIAAAKPSLTRQVQVGSYDWIVPFVIHEGVLIAQDSKVPMQYRDADPNTKREYIVSVVSTKDGWAGMSGAGAYVLDTANTPFLYGIVIGGNDDFSALDVMPIANIIKLIESMDSTPIEIISK